MAAYSVYFDRDVEKDLQRIPKGMAQRIIAKCLALASNPRPIQSLKLEGTPNTYRLRIGDYRVIYQIDDTQHGVIIYHIRSRQSAYRGY